MSNPQVVLIVDDQPENIGLLHSFLSERGYALRMAADGAGALKIAHSEIPDIVLLDVMMPGMDGFEVCRRLKADSPTAEVPVIFMTALADLDNKLEGFAAGAVDYITKPFDQHEVVARIGTQLKMSLLRRELKERNHELEERNAELDAFAHTVAHDLKNPLNLVANYGRLLLSAEDSFSPQKRADMLAAMVRNAFQASDIIEALLLLAGTSRNLQFVTGYFPMEDPVKRALSRLENVITDTGAVIRQPQSWPACDGYGPWVEEVWANYLSNALKYGGAPPVIELGAEESDEEVQLWVSDNGPGLSEMQQQRLFTPFTRLHKDRAEGHGLGLSIVERIVKHLKGRVGVESQPGEGSRFYFTLPKYQQTRHEHIRLENGELVFD